MISNADLGEYSSLHTGFVALFANIKLPAPPVHHQEAAMSSLPPLLLLCCLPGLTQAGQVLAGYHFQDNLLQERFGPQNGYTTFMTGRPVPDQVSPESVGKIRSTGSDNLFLSSAVTFHYIR